MAGPVLVLSVDPPGAGVSYAGLVILGAVRRLWAAPRAPGAPTRVWRDWVLFGLILASGTFESLGRDDEAWPVVAYALVVGLSLIHI